MSRSEQATSYAALILADDDVGISVSADCCLVLEDADQSIKADKLLTLIKAANVEDVEPIWATLFAKVRILHPDIRHYIQSRQKLTCETGTRGKEC